MALPVSSATPAATRGFAAQRNLWFNPPVLVQYAPGEAFIAHVNERIAESPSSSGRLRRCPGAPRS